MQPKRTVVTNYYDCYEVGYVKLYGRNGEPAGQTKNVIIKTLNKEAVEVLANLYGIKFIDYTDILATGYYIREVETTQDPDTFHDELSKLENVFMEEVELKQLRKRRKELTDAFDDFNNFVRNGDFLILDPKIQKEYSEVCAKEDELDYKLHGRN